MEASRPESEPSCTPALLASLASRRLYVACTVYLNVRGPRGTRVFAGGAGAGAILRRG